MDRTFVKSPFENVMNFLNVIPQGHEKALKHALYNAIALLLLLICSAAGWGLFYILEPFVKPLIWALLIGSVLHPFKYSLSERFESWFQQLEASTTPIFLAILMVPVHLIDDISETIGNTIMTYIKLIFCLGIGIMTVFLAYTYIPNFCITIITQFYDVNYQVLLYIMNNFSTQLFIILMAGYVTVLSCYWSQEYRHLFSVASYFVWLFISIFAARMLGFLQIPLFLFILASLTFGFMFEIIHAVNAASGDTSYWKAATDAIQGKIDIKCDASAENLVCDAETDDKRKNSRSQTEFEMGEGSQTLKEFGDIDDTSKANLSHSFKSMPYRKSQRVSSLPVATQDPLQKVESHFYTSFKRGMKDKNGASKNEQLVKESSKYIYGVLWACSLMLVWKHMWVVHLLPIPIAVYFIKHIGLYFGLWEILFSQGSGLKEIVLSWIEVRESAIFPAPVQGLFKFSIKLRVNVMNAIKDSINSFASSLVIFGLIFFTFGFSVFIALQIYAEGIHLVTVVASIINSTVVHNPEFLQLLPEGWGDKMESVLNNAYLYGREGISRKVQSMLKDVDKAKAAEFEKHILEFWDRVYQAWLMGAIDGSSVGPKVTSTAVFSSWDNFIDIIQKTPDLFNLRVMTEFAKDNVGTLVSLLESVWMLLKGNINLVFQFFFATLSIVLGGGTAVLNFVISTIVFLTALFYLLSSSGVLYKPVDLLSNFSPINGNKLGVAFEAAVNGVFKASFKMALFYGLWTWLIHNLFQVRIVYLPSVLAAILGAVPFLGTYWASVPAVLDLWLAQHKGIQAIILFVFQCLPISFVDTAIYMEIKGGGHPYMTGLAIAGGVFCMGMEGAILGPVLLCCLLVALNMSSTLMKESPSDTAIPSLSMRQLRRDSVTTAPESK